MFIETRAFWRQSPPPHQATFTDSHPHVPIKCLRLPPITRRSPISQLHDCSVRLCSARFHCFTLLMFFLESIRRQDWSLQLSINSIVVNHSNLVLHLGNAKWMAKLAHFNDNVNCICMAQSEHEYSTKFQHLWEASSRLRFPIPPRSDTAAPFSLQIVRTLLQNPLGFAAVPSHPHRTTVNW